MTNDELDNLKTLLFSEDDANYELAMELAKAINLNSWSVYADLKKCADYFNLHKKQRPIIRECIQYVREKQFNFDFFELNYLPEYLAVLEPIVHLVKLANNRFTSIPSPILAYSRLEELHIRFNNISELSDKLWELPYLHTLDISHNPIIQLPKTIKNSKALANLNLLCPTFTAIPEELSAVSSLKSITWGFHEYKSIQQKEIPANLFLCSSLEKLSLYGGIWKDLPNSIGQLKNLKELSVIDGNMRTLPDTLFQLKQLKSLRIESNQGFKQIPRIVFEMPQLEQLMLPILPTEEECILFRQLPNLKYLYFVGQYPRYDVANQIRFNLKEYAPQAIISVK